MNRNLIDDALPMGGAFYRCVAVGGCGLRFPVTPQDVFGRKCPRCGGDVEMVARVQDELSTYIAERSAARSSQLSLLLDNWRSIFNVGAAFRTADGVGVRQLYLGGITATPEQPKVAKTALGAEQSVAWSYHPDSVTLAVQLQNAGAQLWVMERGAGAVDLFDITSLPDAPVVLIAGNEVLGVDPGLLARADCKVQVPMVGRKESLNVAVAMSVAAYWLRGVELRAPA